MIYLFLIKKYTNKIRLKRFSIAIFGKISSGKSTFWNYILGLKDLLEVKSDITTKFICFISHKEEIITPEIFEDIPENRKTINEKKCLF